MSIILFILFLIFVYFLCMLLFHTKFREWMFSEIRDTIYNVKFHRINGEIYNTNKLISSNEKQIQLHLFRIEELKKILSLKYAEIEIVKEKMNFINSDINILNNSYNNFSDNLLNSVSFYKNIDYANKVADDIHTELDNHVVKLDKPLMFNPENSSQDVKDGIDFFNPDLSIKLHNYENED